MPNSNSPIYIESDVAALYNNAAPEIQLRLQALMRLWLDETQRSDTETLLAMMDKLSDKAQARGLTPEILESILNEAD
jgi:hypothetical protein